MHRHALKLVDGYRQRYSQNDDIAYGKLWDAREDEVTETLLGLGPHAVGVRTMRDVLLQEAA